MPGKKTGQRYFVAEQTAREDGKVVLTLLEESKGSNECVSMIRSEPFAKAYPGDRAFRVAIIRAEPALRLVRKPNELAAAIGKAQGVTEVLAILAARGIAVTDGVEFTEAEDVPGGVPEEEKDAEEAAETTAAAAPSTAPKIPDIRTLPLEQLLELAKSVNPSADKRWSKAACLATLTKHQTSGGMFIPGPDLITPSVEGSWSSITCPHCRVQTWMNTDTGERFNQTAGYPTHSCPGHDAEVQAAIKAPPTPPPAPTMTAPPPVVVAPPAPAAPPAPVAPPVAAAPLIPPGAEGAFQPGLVQPPNRSGQAPPKMPPKPPMPPGFGSAFGVH